MTRSASGDILIDLILSMNLFEWQPRPLFIMSVMKGFHCIPIKETTDPKYPKMLFGHRFNVFWTLWTSDGRQNNVVCLLRCDTNNYFLVGQFTVERWELYVFTIHRCRHHLSVLNCGCGFLLIIQIHKEQTHFLYWHKVSKLFLIDIAVETGQLTDSDILVSFRFAFFKKKTVLRVPIQ